MTILVGTHHLELRGHDRIARFIKRFRPNLVTVEYPEMPVSDAVSLVRKKRAERAQELEKYGLPVNVKAMILTKIVNIDYETFMLAELSGRRGFELFCVDSPSLLSYESNSAKHVKDMIEQFYSMPQEFTETIERMPLHEVIDSLKNHYDFLYYPESSPRIEIPGHKFQDLLVTQLGTELVRFIFSEQRTDGMAARINRINPDMHFGGLAHIFEEDTEAHGLRQTVVLANKVDYSERYKLIEADGFLVP